MGSVGVAMGGMGSDIAEEAAASLSAASFCCLSISSFIRVAPAKAKVAINAPEVLPLLIGRIPLHLYDLVAFAGFYCL